MSPRETGRQASFRLRCLWPIGGIIRQYQDKTREKERYEANASDNLERPSYGPPTRIGSVTHGAASIALSSKGRKRLPTIHTKTALGRRLRESQAALATIRHNTHTDRPLGSAAFLRAVEWQTKRRLALQKRGPKRAAEPGKNQGTFSFGA
jgi:hypothetical protein